MYEELIKQLRDNAEFLVKASSGCLSNSFADTMYQAADAIEELSRDVDSANEANIALYGALPKWIPVTEQLPEQDVANYCGGVIEKQEYPVPEQRGAWLDWLRQEVDNG